MSTFESRFESKFAENVSPIFNLLSVEFSEFYKAFALIGEKTPAFEFKGSGGDKFIRLTWGGLPTYGRAQVTDFLKAVKAAFPAVYGWGVNYLYKPNGSDFILVFHHLAWLPLFIKDNKLLAELKAYFKSNPTDY